MSTKYKTSIRKSLQKIIDKDRIFLFLRFDCLSITANGYGANNLLEFQTQ